MNLVILVVLLVLTLLMSYKNFKRIGQYKKDKTYIDLYTKVLRGEESVHEELSKYVETENDPCLNTKARIVKAYDDLLLGNNPSNELKDVDIKNIYFENDKFSSEKAKLNSEIFVWLTLMLSKARCLSMIDLMNELYAKVNVYEEDLKVLVEYQVFKSAYNSLLEKGTEGITFLKQLLSGEYGEYVYDKNLIGIYKKIACCLLAFEGEPLDEDEKAMLTEFTGTLVGNRFTRDLEIYDEFAPKEETEEVKETESDEEGNKEEVIESNEVNDQVSDEVKEEITDETTEETQTSNEPEVTMNEPQEAVVEEKEEIKEDDTPSNEIEDNETSYEDKVVDEEVNNIEENIVKEEKEVAEETNEPEVNDDRSEEEVQASIQKAEDDLLNSLTFGEDKD